jgi:hypothetical protein
MMLYSLVGGSQSFRGMYHLHLFLFWRWRWYDHLKCGNSNRTTQRYNPEDHHQHFHHSENLKSCIENQVSLFIIFCLEKHYQGHTNGRQQGWLSLSPWLLERPK